MATREEVIKIAGAILNPGCGGFNVNRFRREYRERAGDDFPVKLRSNNDPQSDEPVDVLIVKALEEMGCVFEKRPIDKDGVKERLILVAMGKGGRSGGGGGVVMGSTAVTTVRIDDEGRKDKTWTKRGKVGRSTSAHLSVAKALADYPFVLKSVKTRCPDLIPVVSTLAERNRRESRPTVDRMKIALRIHPSEYPPDTMAAQFLSGVATGFDAPEGSYFTRAEELPSCFFLRVTRVEEDGFRFWGRVISDTPREKEEEATDETPMVNGMEEAAATEEEENNADEKLGGERNCVPSNEEKKVSTRTKDEVDSDRMLYMEKELASLVDSDIEGIGDSGTRGLEDLDVPLRPVVALHEGRWCRGWTMRSDCDSPKDIARVFLVDEGRVVIEELYRLRCWNTALAEAKALKDLARPPLAMPFFMKGCQRQNRGAEFLRRQILGKVVRVAKSRINRTEHSGKCVTPVVVLDWKTGRGQCEEEDEEGRRKRDAEAERERKANENEVAEANRAGTVEVGWDEEFSAASTSFDPLSTLNFYHGESVLETWLPEDAVHRSLVARFAQFGLDAYRVVEHVAKNNLKIHAAYIPPSSLWQPRIS